MCWGVRDTSRDGELVGVCGFATPISENVRKSIWKDDYAEEMKNYTTELHRLVTLDDSPHNTETWLISRALKGLKKYKPKYKAVISFADTTEDHVGTIYQASNFYYYGMTEPEPCFVDEDGNLRSARQGGERVSVEEGKERGWKRVERKAKHRYFTLLPDPYESKKDVMEKIGVETRPYPNE